MRTKDLTIAEMAEAMALLQTLQDAATLAADVAKRVADLLDTRGAISMAGIYCSLSSLAHLPGLWETEATDAFTRLDPLAIGRAIEVALEN